MPIQTPQWAEFLSCPVCQNEFETYKRSPVSLCCGHTVCKTCLESLQRSQCPFDQSPIGLELSKLPVNTPLLQLIGKGDVPEEFRRYAPNIAGREKDQYFCCVKAMENLALFLKPSHCSQLSRPMQRKLITLVTSQLLQEEGRARGVRAARSLGERSVTELILQHQNPQQLSANLWAAVRARGCQFLGPAMQEEVLKLVLLALEDGSALSRKVLVMFVVQRLEPHFPQASKTSIGHVVQLLYRASCFKVTKREGDSSLMQLKEEFRTYDNLRREHDTQIVQIALEAGLRIAPDQWSSLLYGDLVHKSHMQSIIDKLQTPQSFGQSVQELMISVQRTGDPAGLTSLRPHLDMLTGVDPNTGEGENPAPVAWDLVLHALKAVHEVVAALISFCVLTGTKKTGETFNGQVSRYKTSMCRDLSLHGSCPRGNKCTFAHSNAELEFHRNTSRGPVRGKFSSGTAIASRNSSTEKQVGRPQIQMNNNPSPVNQEGNQSSVTVVKDEVYRPESGAAPIIGGRAPEQETQQHSQPSRQDLKSPCPAPIKSASFNNVMLAATPPLGTMSSMKQAGGVASAPINLMRATGGQQHAALHQQQAHNKAVVAQGQHQQQLPAGMIFMPTGQAPAAAVMIAARGQTPQPTAGQPGAQPHQPGTVTPTPNLGLCLDQNGIPSAIIDMSTGLQQPTRTPVPQPPHGNMGPAAVGNVLVAAPTAGQSGSSIMLRTGVGSAGGLMIGAGGGGGNKVIVRGGANGGEHSAMVAAAATANAIIGGAPGSNNTNMNMVAGVTGPPHVAAGNNMMVPGPVPPSNVLSRTPSGSNMNVIAMPPGGGNGGMPQQHLRNTMPGVHPGHAVQLIAPLAEGGGATGVSARIEPSNQPSNGPQVMANQVGGGLCVATPGPPPPPQPQQLQLAQVAVTPNGNTIAVAPVQMGLVGPVVSTTPQTILIPSGGPSPTPLPFQLVGPDFNKAQRNLCQEMGSEIASQSLSELQDRKEEIISELEEIVGPSAAKAIGVMASKQAAKQTGKANGSGKASSQTKEEGDQEATEAREEPRPAVEQTMYGIWTSRPLVTMSMLRESSSTSTIMSNATTMMSSTRVVKSIEDDDVSPLPEGICVSRFGPISRRTLLDNKGQSVEARSMMTGHVHGGVTSPTNSLFQPLPSVSQHPDAIMLVPDQNMVLGYNAGWISEFEGMDSVSMAHLMNPAVVPMSPLPNPRDQASRLSSQNISMLSETTRIQKELQDLQRRISCLSVAENSAKMAIKRDRLAFELRMIEGGIQERNKDDEPLDYQDGVEAIDVGVSTSQASKHQQHPNSGEGGAAAAPAQADPRRTPTSGGATGNAVPYSYW